MKKEEKSMVFVGTKTQAYCPEYVTDFDGETWGMTMNIDKAKLFTAEEAAEIVAIITAEGTEVEAVDVYYVDYDNGSYYKVLYNNGSRLNYCEEYTVNEEGWLEIVDDDARLTDGELKKLAIETH